MRNFKFTAFAAILLLLLAFAFSPPNAAASPVSGEMEQTIKQSFSIVSQKVPTIEKAAQFVSVFGQSVPIREAISLAAPQVAQLPAIKQLKTGTEPLRNYWRPPSNFGLMKRFNYSHQQAYSPPSEIVVNHKPEIVMLR